MRLLVTLLIACGGGSGPAATVGGPPTAPAQLVAPGAAPDDAIVATVDGRPVWGSCVAIQAARDPAVSRAQALEQCISFELLAREAERRGLATHAEVIDATRTALVSRLVDRFAARYPDPSSMAPQIDEVLRTQGQAISRPELRASTHALIKLPSTPPADLDAKAKVVAEALHAKLADETGLFKYHLADLAKTVTVEPPVEVVVEDLPPLPHENSGLARSYIDALFAIPEVGRVSPVTRSRFSSGEGYHVILLTEILPAETMPREQIFARLRSNQFIGYVGELMKDVRVEVNTELLASEAAP